MNVFGDFVVERCGNADVYFIADANMAEEVEKNTWSLDGHGYICRNKNGKVERMHRLFVELAAGGPLQEGATIDHINKCKTDNRLCNLRVVSQAENMKNLSMRANNTTGYTGVAPVSKGKGYRAYITVNKKRMGLGTYPTVELAARARYAAEERYGFKHQQNLAAFMCEMMEGGDV